MPQPSPTIPASHSKPAVRKAAGRVRPAERRDLDRVLALWTDITRHHAALDPLFRQRTDAQGVAELRRLIEAMLRDRDAAIFVFETPPGSDEPGDLAGLCIVRIDRAPPILEETERAEITDLGVRETLRRRGIATRLLATALDWVRAAGVERIELQVAVGNPEGQAFWRAHGFRDLMDVLHRRL